MRLTLPVMTGDGIGPEVVGAALDVATTVCAGQGVELVAEILPAGLAALESLGHTMPPSTVERLTRGHAAVLGPLTTHALDPDDPAQPNGSAFLRKHFGLAANVRPASALFGVPLSPAHAEVDLVIVRENTEGFYADRNMTLGRGEFIAVPGVGLAVRLITAEASRAVAEVAFRLAERRAASGRPARVTAVHKANVLRYTDGIFLDAIAEVAARFPAVRLDDLHVDAAATELLENPGRFDVIVTTNMFGDILSNEAAGLIGGLGYAPSLNVAPDASFALAQASHGSAPGIAGTGQANPVAVLLSIAMLLDWLADRDDAPALAASAREIERRVAVLSADGVRIGSTAGVVAALLAG